MSKKVTIVQVAKKIGVSTTTVHRALSGKGRIGIDTKRLIMETAKEMGFKANKAAMSLARKTIKIGFVTVESIYDFNNEVISGAQKACEDLSDFNVSGDFQIVSRKNARLMIQNKMIEMGESGYSGIIILPTEDKRNYDIVIDELLKMNIPVVTVVGDCPNWKSLFSVKNNGKISGKLAAELLWMLVKQEPVAIFAGFKDIGIHKENVDGFMEQLKRNPLNLVAIYDNQDDLEIAYLAVDKLLREYPDVKGIYICSSNSVTVCKRIIELDLVDKVKIISSDIFPELNAYLEKGIVHATIFQDPFNQGRLAVKYLYEYIAENRVCDKEILLKPQIVLSGNLELFNQGR